MTFASSIREEYLDDSGELPIFFPEGRCRMGRQKAYLLSPNIDIANLLSCTQNFQRWATIYILLMPLFLIGGISVLHTAFPELWPVVLIGTLTIISTPIFLLRGWYFSRLRQQLKDISPVWIIIAGAKFVFPSKTTCVSSILVSICMLLEIVVIVMLRG